MLRSDHAPSPGYCRCRASARAYSSGTVQTGRKYSHGRRGILQEMSREYSARSQGRLPKLLPQKRQKKRRKPRVTLTARHADVRRRTQEKCCSWQKVVEGSAPPVWVRNQVSAGRTAAPSEQREQLGGTVCCALEGRGGGGGFAVASTRPARERCPLSRPRNRPSVRSWRKPGFRRV